MTYLVDLIRMDKYISIESNSKLNLLFNSLDLNLTIKYLMDLKSLFNVTLND